MGEAEDGQAKANDLGGREEADRRAAQRARWAKVKRAT